MKKIMFIALSILAAGWLFAEDKMVSAWDFSRENPLTSGSSKVELRSQSVIEDGMLIASNADKSKPFGAVISNRDAVNAIVTKGAFSLSVTFMIGPKWVRPERPNAYLLDTKYVENRDNFHAGFMFYLASADGKNFTPHAAFGFGDKSASVTGQPVNLSPDVLHTAELIFSGTGKVSFLMDGKACGSGTVPAGSVVASRYYPTLGDRIGSDFGPLGGGIRSVVLKEIEFDPIAIVRRLDTRTAFERGEEGKSLHFQLSNVSPKTIGDVTVNASVGDLKLASLNVGTVAAGQEIPLSIPVDTKLIPGTYDLNLDAFDGAGNKVAHAVEEFTVVPAYGDFMPVVLWGGADTKELKSIGFTHQGCGLFPAYGDFKAKDVPEYIQYMDNNLKGGLYLYSNFHLYKRFVSANRFLRKDRYGKNYPRPNVEASNPEVRKEVAKVVEDTAKVLGEHPAWDSVLSNSEVRDSSNPSFTGEEEAAFQKYAGYAIPADVNNKYPLDYDRYPEYPWDRVLPDQDPHLTYFSWFWRTGDGWNDLHTLISDLLHKHINHHFWTFYDPATRVPPQWGSGGKVDVVNQWTYSYPDPIKIGQATDELVAMAQGQKGQQVMSMTQIIWYRSQTSPMGKKIENEPAWVKEHPEAMYITIAPDCLREALWTKLSRRISGIMYHGVNALLPGLKHPSYRFTNGESKEVLREMLHKVVKPLGPALKAIPERESEVAILEGFTATLFARQHASFGWSNNWFADLHLALQWAHFQPVVLFDEHLLNDMQSKNLKVLFLPGYEVTTEKVAAKLRALQKKGVILVGDENTCPGISPDFRITSVKRKADPAATKAELQKLGKQIAGMLKPYYQSPVSASSPDIVVRRRGSDKADYVFLVNDKRTFGDYVGQWKLVMEKGLPIKGTVTVNHPSGAAYDVVNHKPIAFRNEGNKTVLDASLPAGDGALILLTGKPIAGIDVTLPAKPVAKGGAYDVAICVKDNSGQAVESVLPLEIVLTSVDGVKLPGSGYYAAHDGKFTLKEIAATNMTAGKVDVLVRDLASGKTAAGSFIVK